MHYLGHITNLLVIYKVRLSFCGVVSVFSQYKIVTDYKMQLAPTKEAILEYSSGKYSGLGIRQNWV